MNKKEIQGKVKEIVNAYQLIVDLKQKLYNACPNEKEDELYEELRNLWCGSDLKVRTRKICNIIGADKKEKTYKEPSFCYDERSKTMSMTAESSGFEMHTLMQSDPNFVEAVIDVRTDKNEPYSSIIKVIKDSKSKELKVFLYGDYKEDENSLNYKSFVKRSFQEKKE